MTKIAIHGAAGRMGLRLIALAHADKSLEIVSAVESATFSGLGSDAGTLAGVGPIDVPFQSQIAESADVVIDFSTPDSADSVIDWCRENRVALVMATTGLSEATEAKLNAASSELSIVFAPNMSLAVNLTMKLSQIAAAALKDHGTGADVEIIETHHRYKADAPSGTALKFGELISSAMGLTNSSHGREGILGERPHNEVGYHAVRAGDDPGQHTILFGMLGEKIELKVAASNRDCYASGALEAAKFLVGQPAGLYSMYDVLGLES